MTNASRPGAPRCPLSAAAAPWLHHPPEGSTEDVPERARGAEGHQGLLADDRTKVSLARLTASGTPRIRSTSSLALARTRSRAWGDDNNPSGTPSPPTGLVPFPRTISRTSWRSCAHRAGTSRTPPCDPIVRNRCARAWATPLCGTCTATGRARGAGRVRGRTGAAAPRGWQRGGHARSPRAVGADGAADRDVRDGRAPADGCVPRVLLRGCSGREREGTEQRDHCYQTRAVHGGSSPPWWTRTARPRARRYGGTG